MVSSADTCGTPPWISATSVEVPPMSYVMALAMPDCASVAEAAITPEAGPDMMVLAASRATTRADTVPPLPFMTSRSRLKPRASSSPCRRRT